MFLCLVWAGFEGFEGFDGCCCVDLGGAFSAVEANGKIRLKS